MTLPRHIIHFTIPSTERGWIDPLGQFWGCDEGGHAVLILSGFRISRYEANQRSWVCVQVPVEEAKPIYKKHWFCDSKQGPNEAQKAVMLHLGLDPQVPYKRGPSISFSELYPEGYKNHKWPFDNVQTHDLRSEPATP